VLSSIFLIRENDFFGRQVEISVRAMISQRTVIAAAAAVL
jgi:hypothetical protein